MKSILFVLAVCIGVAVAAPVEQKFLSSVLDIALNLFGLNEVWATIQTVGSNLLTQFTSILTALVFSGQQILAQAMPILSQLTTDLMAHASNAVPLLTQSIASLTVLVGKRGLVENIVSLLGLDAVWGTISALGSSVVSQFITIGAQLLVSGQAIFDQAKPIFAQLTTDLLAHGTAALPLVTQSISTLTALVGKRSIIDTIMNTLGLNTLFSLVAEVGGNLLTQFTQVATQILFAGQNIIALAQPIFAQLTTDLMAHAGNAVPLLTQSIASLTALVTIGGKRGIFDTIFEMLGISQLISLVSEVGGNLMAQFTQVATQILFAGQNIIALAQPIFTQLTTDLMAHAGNAVPLITQSIASLTSLVSLGKRGIIDTITEMLGLNTLFSLVAEVGGQIMTQFTQVITQLFFAGSNIIALAQPILSQLTTDLMAHAGNAVPLLTQSIASLTSLINLGWFAHEVEAWIAERPRAA